VLIRCGKAEEGGNPVAHIGVDDTAELFDRATHAIHAAADQCREVLRGESFRERRGAHDVGEQRADGSQFVFGCDGGGRGSLKRRLRAGRRPDGDREHLDASRADLDHIPGREGHRAGDAFAVHPGSVERSEVLDLESLAGRSENRVCSRDLRVFDHQAGVVAASDRKLTRDRNTSPTLRAVEDRHKRRVPGWVAHYAMTLPIRWCQNLHQAYRPG